MLFWFEFLKLKQKILSWILMKLFFYFFFLYFSFTASETSVELAHCVCKNGGTCVRVADNSYTCKCKAGEFHCQTLYFTLSHLFLQPIVSWSENISGGFMSAGILSFLLSKENLYFLPGFYGRDCTSVTPEKQLSQLKYTSK